MPFDRRQFRNLTGAILLCAGVAAPARGIEPSDDRDTFVSTYQCSIVDVLGRIRAHKGGKDRYLILAGRDNPAGYVQCLFHDEDQGLYCEAASGWWENVDHHPSLHFSPDQMAMLAKLGFSTDGSHGNFKQDGRARDDEKIADLMLTALYSIYDARLSTQIEIHAPYVVQKGILKKSHCTPIS
jgi:hypothetical protein